MSEKLMQQENKIRECDKIQQDEIMKLQEDHMIRMKTTD